MEREGKRRKGNGGISIQIYGKQTPHRHNHF